MRLAVITPRGTLLEAEVDEVTAPGTAGEFGVLPGHVPLLAGLRPGVVSWRAAGTTGRVAIGKGFAEVIADAIVVLVDVGEKPEQIDAARARRDLDEARRELEALEGGLPETRAAAEEKQAWAQARLSAVTPAAAGLG